MVCRLIVIRPSVTDSFETLATYQQPPPHVSISDLDSPIELEIVPPSAKAAAAMLVPMIAISNVYSAAEPPARQRKSDTSIRPTHMLRGKRAILRTARSLT
jgi:hypothetical protein